MYARKRRQYSLGRPRKREPMPSHPLPRALGARSAGDAFVPMGSDGGGQSAASSLEHTQATAARARGLRGLALFIMALVPLSIGVWALSVVVPVVIEAREAMDDVFVTPVAREHLDGAQPSPPQLPTSVDGETPAIGTPEAGQAASPTSDDPETPLPEFTPTLEPTLEPDATPSPVPPTATPYPAWDGDEPVHILLLGVDSRPEDEAPPRSDTIIVVRVDPVLERVDMFSIPRDLLVDIPGYQAQKINAAYIIGEIDDLPGGGPILAAQTIEYNFGIRIDYFATVSISGMEHVVDTIGGIVLDVPAPLKDDQYPTEDYRLTRAYFGTGPQKMDGVQAVRYARTRHDDNDFKRSERQQQVLLALRNQILISGVITKLPQLISEVGDSVRTDLSPRQVLSLARFGQDLPRSSIYIHSINGLLEEVYIDEEFFFVADWYTTRSLVQNLPDNPYATSRPGE